MGAIGQTLILPETLGLQFFGTAGDDAAVPEPDARVVRDAS